MAIYLDRIKSALPPLLEREFRIVSMEGRPEVFGNTCVVVESTKLAIRLIFDRGQFFVDVRAARSGGKWFSLADLVPLLVSGNGSSCSTPVDAVDLILARGVEITRLAETPKTLEDEGLVGRRQRRATAQVRRGSANTHGTIDATLLSGGDAGGNETFHLIFEMDQGLRPIGHKPYSSERSRMRTKFADFVGSLQSEAREAGPAAVAELEALREHFRIRRKLARARHAKNVTRK